MMDQVCKLWVIEAIVTGRVINYAANVGCACNYTVSQKKRAKFETV